jgi:hypothetical protein
MAYTHDVFLSYSRRDTSVVCDLAKRLRDRGLRVWFDGWEMSPGDSIPSRIEAGLEGSAVLVFCASKHSLGSDWALLESQTFRFRDPLNRKRRFIPLRLDDTPLRAPWHSSFTTFRSCFVQLNSTLVCTECPM